MRTFKFEVELCAQVRDQGALVGGMGTQEGGMGGHVGEVGARAGGRKNNAGGCGGVMVCFGDQDSRAISPCFSSVSEAPTEQTYLDNSFAVSF